MKPTCFSVSGLGFDFGLTLKGTHAKGRVTPVHIAAVNRFLSPNLAGDLRVVSFAFRAPRQNLRYVTIF